MMLWNHKLFLSFCLVLLLFVPLSSHSNEDLCEDYVDAIDSNFLDKLDDLARSLKATRHFESPTGWRTKSKDIGLPGLDLPEAFGGLNWPAKQMIRVFSHLGRYSLNMRDMVGGGHARLLLNSESAEVHKVLKKVAQGDAYIAVAVTEKNSGSDIRSMSSTSEKVEGGYLLTGEKMYNARLSEATHIVLFTKAAQFGEGTNKLNAFLIPKDKKGLEYKEISAHGMHGNSFGGVSFNKIFVPDEYRLGNEGEATLVFHNHFLYWRLMMSATAIGTGQKALSLAVERMRSRHAFGGPIARFTHLQQELAEHTAKLHMAGLLIRQAASLIDQNRWIEARPLVAMAKGEGVEWALKASDFAMQLFGAEGYSHDFVDLAQRVADLQGLRVADGTTHVMRQEVVKHVYGSDLWKLAIGKVDEQAPSTSQQIVNNHPSEVFSFLRNQISEFPDALASQEKFSHLVYTSGGGPCPTVSAANLIQGLRVMTGELKPLDLEEVIVDLYQRNPALREGRLSNLQIIDVIAELQEMYLPKHPVDIDIETQNWETENFDVHPNELKLLSYTIDLPGEIRHGRHFVIVKSRTANKIAVVDPTDPTGNFYYNLERTKESEAQPETINLVRPDRSIQTLSRLTVNAIFTVRLK